MVLCVKLGGRLRPKSVSGNLQMALVRPNVIFSVRLKRAENICFDTLVCNSVFFFSLPFNLMVNRMQMSLSIQRFERSFGRNDQLSTVLLSVQRNLYHASTYDFYRRPAGCVQRSMLRGIFFLYVMETFRRNRIVNRHSTDDATTT